MSVRVFLLDDHPLVRQGVRHLLESDGGFEVVGEGGDAANAVELIGESKPDVAVLDVRLGDGNGVEVCREIRSTFPSVKCLMLTSFADDEALARAILAGAAGYVLKQVHGDDLVRAIRSAASGHFLIDAQTSHRVLNALREKNADADRLEWLTHREREILDLIAAGKTNRAIGEELFIAEKTVKNYISNMLAKLGMSRRTEAAAYAARLEERRAHDS